MTAQTRKIKLFKVPFASGTSRPGTEHGADSLIEAGLGRMIRNLGLEMTEENFPVASDVEKVSSLLADRAASSVVEGAFPLVLGGDRSVSAGAVAGVTRGAGNTGLIWFDAHPSLLTAETSTTGFANGMALSSILSEGHVRKENVVLVGLRDVQPGEREWIRSEGLTCFTMHEIDRLGVEKVIEAALGVAGNGTDGIHVSLDADVLDPLEAPGVDWPVPGGLFFREAHFAFELLSESGRITSMDVTEVNPYLDEKRRTSKLIAGLIASLLGKKIL
ncbi:arginase [Cohnella pontilimi]|uniref:Arginase n=1 Tax=Cohnella pontilimi TaxID=2564100 RepID=A0A4U0FD72_9BACL|nr:arginase [Cohnella pontilimi]TJY42863.1 arginase [Cohnella pontilimi]